MGANNLTSFDDSILPTGFPQFYLFLSENKLSSYPDFTWGKYGQYLIALDNNRFTHLPLAEYSGMDVNTEILMLQDNCIGWTQDEDDEF